MSSLLEEELQEEKERMYEAIGYSENAEVPIYPKEVMYRGTQHTTCWPQYVYVHGTLFVAVCSP